MTGHSLTIVGFERTKDGKANLLVFDPSYHDSTFVTNLVDKIIAHMGPNASHVLEQYRRGSRYLQRYREFEVL